MIKETVFGKWYQKHISKYIPEYALFSLLACFILNGLIYWGTKQIMKNTYHYDLTSELDRQIPFVKEWIVIYITCYVFWAVNYILISREGKEKWYRFVTADIMAKLICGIFFIVIPTTNVRPQVPDNDIFSWLVRFIYNVDEPTNLFPSLHCLISWFCYIGIRKSKKTPKWYIIFSFIFSILVCLSTQFTKQHYLIDIAGGILIAELCWFITKRTQMYRGVQTLFDRIGNITLGAK